MSIAPLLGSCRLSITFVLLLGSFTTIFMSGSLKFAVICVDQRDKNSNNLTQCDVNKQKESHSCVQQVPFYHHIYKILALFKIDFKRSFQKFETSFSYGSLVLICGSVRLYSVVTFIVMLTQYFAYISFP